MKMIKSLIRSPQELTLKIFLIQLGP